jgi:4-diphosphocytidyl-2-C-methyl-D-erythritol kinase
MSGRRLTESAPAKLNLTLDILRRRPDGYHDMCMVMQSVSLCDTLTVETGTGAGGIRVATKGAALPDGPENLAYRAAAAFFAAVGMENGGTQITIEKRIPMQAGMAGGSADAAAVLRALRTLCCPTLSEEALEEIGTQVGSDVPFCVRGGAALAEGRGERLRTLNALPDCDIVLCKPDFGLPTPALFGRVQVERLEGHPDTAAMCDALARQDLGAVAAALGNVFETLLTPEEHREIFAIGDTLRAHGALGALMTGSGPTVFGLFPQGGAAAVAAQALRGRYAQTFLAKPLQK